VHEGTSPGAGAALVGMYYTSTTQGPRVPLTVPSRRLISSYQAMYVKCKITSHSASESHRQQHQIDGDRARTIDLDSDAMSYIAASVRIGSTILLLL
jgi:hypothetical protein